MATIGEMIVKLLADTGSFNASMDQAATKVAASSDAMSASMASSMAAFRDFDNITKESVKSAEGLATAQEALRAAQASGAFTAEELAAKEALVGAAMTKVGTDAQAAGDVLGMFTRNSRTMYSTSALITDAMTGQYSRMRREVAALGNETGLMAAAFRALAGPAGLAALAVGTFAVAGIEGALNAEKLSSALQATGGALGVTDSQITQMRDALVDAGASIGDATELVRRLALSGEFLGQSLGDAARAAQSMSELTGESMDSAAAKVEAIGKDPVKALQKLNDEFHFLTVPEAEEIANLIKIGDTAGAAALAIRDLKNAEESRVNIGKSQEGYIGRMVDRWKGGMHTMTAAAESWGAPETLRQQLNDVNDEINKLVIASGAALKRTSDGGIAIAKSGDMQADSQARLNALLAKSKTLTDEIAAASKKAAETAAQTANTTKAANDIIAGAGKGGKGKSGAGDLESELRQEEADQKISYAKRQQFEVEYWGNILNTAKAGSAEYVAAWQHTQQLQREIDEQQLADSKRTASEREQASRRAAAVAKQQLEQQKAEIQKEAQAEAEADRQKLAVERATADTTLQIARAKIDAERAQAQLDLDSHKITAAQLLQTEKNLTNQELAAVTIYYREKWKLDAGDVAAQTKDAAQIFIAKQKSNRQIAADTDKMLKESERKWQQYTQRVQGMIASQVSAILFQHQSLVGAMENILETLLQMWITNELEQLMATKTSNTSKAGSSAALAGAAGVASFAGAPWPIDMGAPAFGAAMAAEAAAFAGAAASAEGGWERVPADGVLTQLHMNEMVLPARVAEPVRRMAKSGAGGGGQPIHIHANDARSFTEFLRRNPQALATGIRNAVRRGNFT